MPASHSARVQQMLEGAVMTELDRDIKTMYPCRVITFSRVLWIIYESHVDYVLPSHETPCVDEHSTDLLWYLCYERSYSRQFLRMVLPWLKTDGKASLREGECTRLQLAQDALSDRNFGESIRDRDKQ